MNNNKKKIGIICGARPNFMKVAPLCKELEKQNQDFFVVNTGQHFTKEMADDFFEEFGFKADYNFTPKRDTVVTQLSDIMVSLEKVFLKEKPSLIVVVGDVNSTLAGALVANKMGIKLAHVEAGLRSFNKEMPEEHNRILTDRISDLLFVTSEDGVENLKKEGIVKGVHFVGNIMMDTMEMFLPEIKESDEEFYFCTLHRAENVDNKSVFEEILDALEVISKDKKIYLPLHPRTRKMAESFGLMKRIEDIFEILPLLNYKESIFYQKNAKLVLTDSGGIQEETTYLGVPCITLRKETERPVTVELGTNIVGGVEKEGILRAYERVDFEKKEIDILKWDGETSSRIIDIIKNYI